MPGLIRSQMSQWKETGLSLWPSFTTEDQVIRELHFELTYRCNLKCRMCDLWNQEIKDTTKIPLEISVAEIRKFVSGSQKLSSLEVIVLSGGEPFLKRETVDLVEFFSRHCPKASIGILSNFFDRRLVETRLAEIFGRCAPNLWLGTSMDGLEAAHDRLRGKAGAWRHVTETIHWLKEKYPSLPVSLTYTMTPHNFRDLLAVHDLAEKWKCGFGAQFVVQKEGTELFRWKPAHLKQVERQIGIIVERLCREGDAIGNIFRGEARNVKWLWSRLFYWQTLMDYGRRPARYFKPCLAGHRYAMVDPWGNVSFCSPHKKKPIGNIRSHPFDALWESERAVDLRCHIDAGKCDCWLMCTANPVIDRVVELAFSAKAGHRLAGNRQSVAAQ